MGAERQRLILASSSRSRQRLLKAAGLAFEVVPAEIDEAAVRAALGGDSGPEDVAEILAGAKAQAVADRHADAVVIGADQVLALDGRIFGKPKDIAEARDHLLALRGRTHQLHSAVVVMAPPSHRWGLVETAHLTMRSFTPEFVGRYLSLAGPEVCRSVGAYQLEALGVQLFERIEGDYFTILGLPLLPLLEELRGHGLLDI